MTNKCEDINCDDQGCPNHYVNKYSLKTLFKKTSKGAVQSWNVSWGEGIITVTQGQVGGKKQEYFTTCEGKNIGKANETTPEKQARLEAKSKWEKKKKGGYSEDPSGEVLIKLPMKVSVYQDNKNKLLYPCTVSPKLNGLNGTYIHDTKQFLSRGGLPLPPPPKETIEELETYCEYLNVNTLNYEIYKYGEYLQDIQSAVKDPEGEQGKRLHKDLEYNVFDIPCQGHLPWSEREELLSEASWGLRGLSKVRTVINVPITDEKDLDFYFKYFVDSFKYEGLIIRNLKGLYEFNKRSNDVFKYKIPLSAEFKVVDYKIDKNDHPVFKCKNLEGTGEFNVKMVGDKEHRDYLRTVAEDYIGNYITVEFEMYSKANIPQKPVGICKRVGYFHEVLNKFIPEE